MFDTLSPPYSTIVADPPWDVYYMARSGGSRGGLAGLPYKTMTDAAIGQLPVAGLADSSCHLYLWTVTAKLRYAFGICELWDFTPKQVLVWAKPGLGAGHRWRTNTEFVVFADRGPSLPILRRDVGTWHKWSRGGHSVKPQGFFDLVESVSPGPYLELFARQTRDGWDGWGDELTAVVER